MKRVATIVGQVWGIARRRLNKDWERRIWMFDKLVWSVMNYGVKI